VRNVTRFNRAILAKPEGALHDWEIFVGLAKALRRAPGRAEGDHAAGADDRLRAAQGALWRCVAWKLSLQRLTSIPMASTWAAGAEPGGSLAHCQPGDRGSPMALLEDLQRLARQLPPEPGQLLLIGRRHVRSNNSWMHNFHRLVKGKPRHQLLMHRTTCQSQLQDGQRCACVHVPV
jgi:anaerobic selenocysteine-containing dehydrogenase